MAISKSLLQLTGSLANVSMYKLHGGEQVVVRMKGGPSKDHIKKWPQFEKLRKNNSEWTGCTRMASEIRCSFSAMNRLEDYPVTGALNAICKQIQKLDTEYEPGSRSVNLTQHKEMLNGFSFSRNQVLESVLRVSIETTLDMVTGEAHITIPQVNTDMYLYNFRKLPYYRIIANLSSTCDTIMNDEEKGYKSPYYVTCDRELGVFESEWMPAAGVQPALDILASGLLTGKFTPSTTFNPNDHRAFNRNGEAFDKGETFAGIDYLKGLNAVEEIMLAGRTGRSWLASFPVLLAFFAVRSDLLPKYPLRVMEMAMEPAFYTHIHGGITIRTLLSLLRYRLALRHTSPRVEVLLRFSRWESSCAVPHTGGRSGSKPPTPFRRHSSKPVRVQAPATQAEK